VASPLGERGAAAELMRPEDDRPKEPDERGAVTGPMRPAEDPPKEPDERPPREPIVDFCASSVAAKAATRASASVARRAKRERLMGGTGRGRGDTTNIRARPPHVP
jgi:hypothetical protein